MEAFPVRLKDQDFEQQQIIIDDGKGEQDRAWRDAHGQEMAVYVRALSTSMCS
jgi:hypothetical protein